MVLEISHREENINNKGNRKKAKFLFDLNFFLINVRTANNKLITK
jgi:hypothetical protein